MISLSPRRHRRTGVGAAAEAGAEAGARQGPRRGRVDGDGDRRRGISPREGRRRTTPRHPPFAPGFLDLAASKGKNRPASKSKSKPRDAAAGPDGPPPDDAPKQPKKQPKKKTKAKYVPEQVNEVPYRTLTFARSVPPPVPEDTIHAPIKIGEFAQRASAGLDELTSLLNDAETNELLKDRTEADVNVDDCIIEPVDKAVTRAIHEMQTRMQREAEEKARVERERAEAGSPSGAAGGVGGGKSSAAASTEAPREGRKNPSRGRRGRATRRTTTRTRTTTPRGRSATEVTPGYLTPVTIPELARHRPGRRPNPNPGSEQAGVRRREGIAVSDAELRGDEPGDRGGVRAAGEGGEREARLAPGGVQVPGGGLSKRKDRKKVQDGDGRVGVRRGAAGDGGGRAGDHSWRGHGIPQRRDSRGS